MPLATSFIFKMLITITYDKMTTTKKPSISSTDEIANKGCIEILWKK